MPATTLKFWGVRGSIPTPGPGTVRYGGNTSCVEVRADGQIIILDDSEPGTITVQTAGGQKITMSTESIKIDNGTDATIELSGPKVAVNDDALEVI